VIAVIQRVSEASVSIKDLNITRSIDAGMLILLGIGADDNEVDISYLVKKISSLRIFSDDAGKMNLSMKETSGKALIVSQFTLHANTRKGNRPSFISAARPEKAIPLYEAFIVAMSAEDIIIETGEFGADMSVSLTNDGPVTIIIDSKNK
jgi:D-aminoacyl-tRNA deacylase